MSSWGRLSALPHDVVELSDRATVAAALARSRPGIAYGLGRSYGDVCLNPGGTLWRTAGLDRLIHFDASTGRLICEAGVVLRDIQNLFLPRGWGLAVLPGTQLVTVGGAIANDVHGKNHHGSGTFGDHVLSIRLQRSDGEEIVCGPAERPDWFAATVGGLGLTGLIVEAELQLRRVPGPWLEAETIAYAGLDAFFRLSDESHPAWEHTVSWIDCTSGGAGGDAGGDAGRGLFLRARPAAVQQGAWRARRLAMPVSPPISLINRLTLKPINQLYWWLNQRHLGPRIVHYQPFLFPLDAIAGWNRAYGPAGFYQYQCVVPRENAPAVIASLLAEIGRSGAGSVLAVLKTFGERWPPGLLSFPQPGTTLALDFHNHAGVEALFERLDALVVAAGGRLYPAKDARMPRAMFEAGYPRLGEFVRYRDPGISSAMSRRLMGG
ncbi:FAD-linked oxidase [Reyranella soli]|uniref:FAD-linked oxidase n=2 Tax=Reyranella soli TaxID=1230389 RepID=A0A512NPA9_9HYPH|nr:FAD-linked oxidase [Reyranella soli]